MKERPILFSAPMVRAILDGSKTQTRRGAILPSDVQFHNGSAYTMRWDEGEGHHWRRDFPCPYGQPGDRLWVRETWGLHDTEPKDGPTNARIYYRERDGHHHCMRHQKWRPSIFMPRWASRITLEITGIRVERLQDITNNDALAEGTPDLRTKENNWDMVRCYQELWEQINGAGSWALNPWVWVVEFKRLA